MNKIEYLKKIKEIVAEYRDSYILITEELMRTSSEKETKDLIEALNEASEKYDKKIEDLRKAYLG